MNILAFDASGQSCSACIAADGKILSSRYLNLGLTHSQTLLPLIRDVMADAGLTMERIDLIAVPVGPGSFTGLKIAVATAKGLAHPYHTPCCPLSSLKTLVWPFSGVKERIFAVQDARRGMFYAGVFQFEQATLRQLLPDCQISAEELFARVEPGATVFLCGDGAALAAEYCKARGIAAVLPSPARNYLRAEAAVEAAMRADVREYVSPAALAPVYLRLPQAERERMEKETKTGKEETK